MDSGRFGCSSLRSNILLFIYNNRNIMGNQYYDAIMAQYQETVDYS